ncbi:MAG: penicillin-binding transpeptidase domain-containing protein [Patescibacteria group bacterium]
MWRRRFKKRRVAEIQPDEIFIDSENLPEFDRDQFEGRIEQPIGRRSFVLLGALLGAVMVAFVARASDLQIIKGEAYATQARENQLTEQIIFADRGIITDWRGIVLAGNERVSVDDDFAQRVYASVRGIAHAIGYVKAPAKDSSGVYFRDSFIGTDGVERVYNELLAGRNGVNLTETNAKGDVVSQAMVRSPVPGAKLRLSLDASVTQALYDAIAKRSVESKFQGGAGVIMDVRTGELLALTNFPEYSPQALTEGDAAALAAYQGDTRQVFLNRATSGLYAPGSIVKPFVAVGALTEGVIDENKQILSTGSISVPNPYDPSKPSVFRDWKAHGYVDMRHAIAVSSDVYFYEVGGGFKDQLGLGIYKLDQYFRLFGFGAPTGLNGFSEKEGTIPTPEWKLATFDGDPWRLGNTYHTAIGQYGMQITPLQAVRAIGALANGGALLTPTLIASSTPQGTRFSIDPHTFEVVREGMRLAVREGTAAALNVPYMTVAAKTGTAQLGTANQFMNSWVIGFFPYEHPRYAFAVVLEKAPAGTLSGSPAAMRAFLDWMQVNEPQYVQ